MDFLKKICLGEKFLKNKKIKPLPKMDFLKKKTVCGKELEN